MKLTKLAISVAGMLFITITSLYAQSYQRTGLGGKANTGSVDVDLQFYSPEIVRVVKVPKGNTWKKVSLSVIKEPQRTFITDYKGAGLSIKL